MQNASDETIRAMLTDTRVVAVVGFSANPARPSHDVARFLVGKGYSVIPVNPGLEGQVFAGESIRARLKDCPPEVEMIDLFRRSEEVGAIVDEAMLYLPNLRSVWMQIGVHDAEAAARAKARGLRVVWNRCPKIEYPRLLG